MDKDNTLFRANDCTSKSAKERYQAFSNWVKEFLASLQAWDVEAQVSTTVHQSLIGTSANPESTVLMTTNQVSTAETGAAQHALVIGTQSAGIPQNTDHSSNLERIKSCPYCKALHQNSDWDSTETSTQIKAIRGFDSNHRQFMNRGRKYILPAGGCVQFLLAPMEVRKAAVEKYSEICPICLAVPRVKHPGGQCKGKHVIQRRLDKPNAL